MLTELLLSWIKPLDSWTNSGVSFSPTKVKEKPHYATDVNRIFYEGEIPAPACRSRELKCRWYIQKLLLRKTKEISRWRNTVHAHTCTPLLHLPLMIPSQGFSCLFCQCRMKYVRLLNQLYQWLHANKDPCTDSIPAPIYVYIHILLMIFFSVSVRVVLALLRYVKPVRTGRKKE